MVRASSLRADHALEHVDLLVIDGNNLLHAVRGSRDRGAVAWLLPRLGGWRPDGLRVLVLLDGHADPGLSDRRPVAPGIAVRHSGSWSADDVIVDLLSRRPWSERARTLVVSGDGGLRDRARRLGAATRGLDWLVGRLSLPPAPGTGPRTPVGIGRPEAPGQGPGKRRSPAVAAEARGDEGAAWRPGRGATRKRGPAHRPTRRRPASR